MQTLLDKGKIQFSRAEIESAIVKTLLVADQRSIDNWFNLIWRLEYFTQPRVGVYQVFFENLRELDVVVDLQQETLDVNIKSINR